MSNQVLKFFCAKIFLVGNQFFQLTSHTVILAHDITKKIQEILLNKLTTLYYFFHECVCDNSRILTILGWTFQQISIQMRSILAWMSPRPNFPQLICGREHAFRTVMESTAISHPLSNEGLKNNSSRIKTVILQQSFNNTDILKKLSPFRRPIVLVL